MAILKVTFPMRVLGVGYKGCRPMYHPCQGLPYAPTLSPSAGDPHPQLIRWGLDGTFTTVFVPARLVFQVAHYQQDRLTVELT